VTATAAVEIVEILGPAEQGRTTPFLCAGDDGLQYYVKGRQTDRRSQWCEWLCSHLGRAFGLPVPTPQLVEISPELLAETQPAWRSLGAGVAFGSECVIGAQWLEPVMFSKVPEAMRRDVLVFDWWVSNLDRNDGNPNLLWQPAEARLAVIDFNLAFDEDYTDEQLRCQHVFRAEAPTLLDDFFGLDSYRPRLAAALEAWDEACNNVPAAWYWQNDEHDVPANFNPAAARAQLMQRVAAHTTP
jgi:HipA-like protein